MAVYAVKSLWHIFVPNLCVLRFACVLWKRPFMSLSFLCDSRMTLIAMRPVLSKYLSHCENAMFVLETNIVKESSLFRVLGGCQKLTDHPGKFDVLCERGSSVQSRGVPPENGGWEEGTRFGFPFVQAARWRRIWWRVFPRISRRQRHGCCSVQPGQQVIETVLFTHEQKTRLFWQLWLGWGWARLRSPCFWKDVRRRVCELIMTTVTRDGLQDLPVSLSTEVAEARSTRCLKICSAPLVKMLVPKTNPYLAE